MSQHGEAVLEFIGDKRKYGFAVFYRLRTPFGRSMAKRSLNLCCDKRKYGFAVFFDTSHTVWSQLGEAVIEFIGDKLKNTALPYFSILRTPFGRSLAKRSRFGCFNGKCRGNN